MAKKKLDLQAILDDPEQLADLQNKAKYKARGIRISKTFAANPDIRVRMAKKTKAKLAADPNIIKKSQAKRLATIAADLDIMKRRKATYQATLAANPDIVRTQQAKRLATLAANPDIVRTAVAKRIPKLLSTLAKKRELHTPYGVFAFKKDAVQALVGRYGFTKNKDTTYRKIGNLIRTNPKEWYWVKKT